MTGKSLAKAAPEGRIFARSPLTVGDFTLSDSGVKAHGKPSLGQWTAALEFAVGCYDKSPHWISCLLQYSETRAEWKERMSQAISVTGLSLKRLENLRSLGKRLTPQAWNVAPSVEHADKVAKLPPDEQIEWLTKAKEGEWTTIQLARNVKRAKQRQILDGKAPQMHYVEVIVGIDVEAQSTFTAEAKAWELVKEAIEHVKSAKVLSAHVKSE